MTESVQNLLGQGVIDILTRFVRRDIKSADVYEAQHFAHVADPDLRKSLAETLYGARWLYALGIASLVKGLERNAHVRVQIIDYSAICEALLGAMLSHAVKGNHTTGQGWLHDDPPVNQRRSRTQLTAANVDSQIRRRSFYWLISVAEEEGFVTPPTAAHLQQLRKDRNSVHLLEHAAHGQRYYLQKGRAAKETLNETIDDTKVWRATHL